MSESKGESKKTKSQEDKKNAIFTNGDPLKRSLQLHLVSSFNSEGNKGSMITYTSEYYRGSGGTRLSFLSSRESINDPGKEKRDSNLPNSEKEPQKLEPQKERPNKRNRASQSRDSGSQSRTNMSSILKKMKEDLGRIKYEIKKRQYNSLETVHFLANLQSRPICGSCEPSRLPISGSVLSQREDFSSYRQLNPKNEEGPRSYKSKPPRQAKEKGTLKVSIRKQPLAHRRGSSSLADCFQSNLLQAAY
jgi:hypothetical protein